MRWKNLRAIVCLTVCGVVAACGWVTLQKKPRFTPGTETVQLLGMVQRPGTYPWQEGMTVTDLLLKAGGLASFANPKVIVQADESDVLGAMLYKARLCAAGMSDSVNTSLSGVWSKWGLPGEAPDVTLSHPPRRVKARVNLRRPQESVRLDPGDVVVVNEMVVNF